MTIGDKMAEHTPLHLACVAGNVHVVKLLLEYGANVEQVVASPSRASGQPRASQLGMSALHRPPLPELGARAVLLSVARGRSRLPPPPQVDKAGFYPFHHAVAHKNSNIVEFLLERGFDANIASHKDGTHPPPNTTPPSKTPRQRPHGTGRSLPA